MKPQELYKELEIDKVELKRKLKLVVWDFDISANDCLDIFLQKKEQKGLTHAQLTAKLLNTFSWYSLLKLLGKENAKMMLRDEVICLLFPTQLRQRYQDAKRILSS